MIPVALQFLIISVITLAWCIVARAYVRRIESREAATN